MESCVVCAPKSHVERELHRSTGSGIELIVSISATGLSGSPSSPPTVPLHVAQNRSPRAGTTPLIPWPSCVSGFVQSGFIEVAFGAMSTVVSRELTQPSRFTITVGQRPRPLVSISAPSAIHAQQVFESDWQTVMFTKPPVLLMCAHERACLFQNQPRSCPYSLGNCCCRLIGI